MSQFTATNDGDPQASPATTADAAIDRAIAAFRAGQPVLIHDAADREGETDLVYPAGAVDPPAVARLRNDAGGLICVALDDAVARELDLPFVQEAVDHPLTEDHELTYDDRSSFSLTVNHRDTHTGVTDRDRALTISAMARMAASPDPETFSRTFRSPGHVHLLRGAPALLADRKGHTELGLALATLAERPPAVVVCEMLDDATGHARSPADARAYATRTEIPYIEGRWLLEHVR